MGIRLNDTSKRLSYGTDFDQPPNLSKYYLAISKLPDQVAVMQVTELFRNGRICLSRRFLLRPKLDG